MGHISTAVVREAGTSTFYNAVETEGHAFVMDEPESMGGTNIGPAPFSLIAAVPAMDHRYPHPTGQHAHPPPEALTSD
jgi:hypothetical protein